MIVLGQIHKEKTITFLQYVIHVITLVSTAWLFIPLFGLELSRHGARSYLHILILFAKNQTKTTKWTNEQTEVLG